MLYKNKKNVLKGVVAFVFMLTLSLSTVLSPLAKAEEARWTWKTLTSAPDVSGYGSRNIYMSPDGSKLFISKTPSNSPTALWMSADDGATWRKIFSKQGVIIGDWKSTVDGSKIVLQSSNNHLYISTDDGQNWTERAMAPACSSVLISPDGSSLACLDPSPATGYIIYISTDDGQNWTRKGTATKTPVYMTNDGTIIAASYSSVDKIAKSTDYGQTWTEISRPLNMPISASYSNNGNNIFDGDVFSLDGGNHWTPSNAPIPSGSRAADVGISDDGKKLLVTTVSRTAPYTWTFLTSVDGGRTWHTDNIVDNVRAYMSSDGSKLFNEYEDGAAIRHRVGTLPAAQPVTPGSGAGGTVAPSTGSTSATPGQKPGKASGRLAETGTSTWTVGGLAVIAVAAGALVLRKRL